MTGFCLIYPDKGCHTGDKVEGVDPPKYFPCGVVSVITRGEEDYPFYRSVKTHRKSPHMGKCFRVSFNNFPNAAHFFKVLGEMFSNLVVRGLMMMMTCLNSGNSSPIYCRIYVEA